MEQGLRRHIPSLLTAQTEAEKGWLFFAKTVCVVFFWALRGTVAAGAPGKLGPLPCCFCSPAFRGVQLHLLPLCYSSHFNLIITVFILWPYFFLPGAPMITHGNHFPLCPSPVFCLSGCAALRREKSQLQYDNPLLFPVAFLPSFCHLWGGIWGQDEVVNCSGVFASACSPGRQCCHCRACCPGSDGW